MTDYEAAFWKLQNNWHESVRHYEARIDELEAELHHCFHRIEELQAALREIVEQIKQYDLPAPVVTLFVLQKARKALEGKDDKA